MPLFGKKPTETEEAKVEFEMTGLTEDEVTSEADVQAVMEKYDRESNVRLWDGIPKTVVRYMLVAFAVYSILLNFGLDWETRIERASFVGILVFLIFIVFPSRKGAGKKQKLTRTGLPACGRAASRGKPATGNTARFVSRAGVIPNRTGRLMAACSVWWRAADSNRRPSACEADALTS